MDDNALTAWQSNKCKNAKKVALHHKNFSSEFKEYFSEQPLSLLKQCDSVHIHLAFTCITSSGLPNA